MSLVSRPASPGDRLFWRPTAAVAETCAQIWGSAKEGMPAPSVDSHQADDDAHRAEGIRKALDHLSTGIDNGRSANYRQARAIIALSISVQRQALVAGLGHVHVGTTACGPMCEPLEGAL